MNTINAAAMPLAPTTPSPVDPSRFPPRDVQVPRDGLRNGIGIPSLVIGGTGAAAAAVSLLRAVTSGGTMRMSYAGIVSTGAAMLVGGIGFGASRLIGPKTEPALAAGMPTRELAMQVDRSIAGSTKIVECVDGTFAILRYDPPVYSNGGGSGSSRPRDDDRPRPSAPRPRNDYPSTTPRSTSPGDSSGPSRPNSPRDSTSNGNPTYGDF